MDADLLIAVFAMSIVANLLTAMAVIGVVLFSKIEKEARSEGRKVRAPGYVYLLILLPAVMGISSLLYVS